MNGEGQSSGDVPVITARRNGRSRTGLIMGAVAVTVCGALVTYAMWSPSAARDPLTPGSRGAGSAETVPTLTDMSAGLDDSSTSAEPVSTETTAALAPVDGGESAGGFGSECADRRLPNMIGMTVEETNLPIAMCLQFNNEGAGRVMSVELRTVTEQCTDDPSQYDRIFAQDPAPGAPLSAVHITVTLSLYRDCSVTTSFEPPPGFPEPTPMTDPSIFFPEP